MDLVIVILGVLDPDTDETASAGTLFPGEYDDADDLRKAIDDLLFYHSQEKGVRYRGYRIVHPTWIRPDGSQAEAPMMKTLDGYIALAHGEDAEEADGDDDAEARQILARCTNLPSSTIITTTTEKENDMQTETATPASASSRRSATAGKAKVTYRCGHTKYVDLDGKPGNDVADAKAREATRLCRDCYIAELKKQSDVAAEEALAFAAERKLPELLFRTEPQRRWAETERHRRIVNLEAYLERANDGDLPKVPGYSAEILKSLTLQAVRDILRDPRASWWITDRAKPIVEVLRERIHKILARRADRQQAAAQPAPAMSRGSAFSDTDIATVR